MRARSGSAESEAMQGIVNNTEEKSQKARSGSSESEAMQGIVNKTEEKSQKDILVTASKPSKPLLT